MSVCVSVLAYASEFMSKSVHASVCVHDNVNADVSISVCVC